MSAAGLIAAVQIWLGVGSVVAVCFLVFGIDRIEPNAKGGYVFRVLITPGLCLLWPIVLWRWRIAASGHEMAGEFGGEAWRNRHSPQRKATGWLGLALAAGIALILLTALLARPGMEAPPPQKIGFVQSRGTA